MSIRGWRDKVTHPRIILATPTTALINYNYVNLDNRQLWKYFSLPAHASPTIKGSIQYFILNILSEAEEIQEILDDICILLCPRDILLKN